MERRGPRPSASTQDATLPGLPSKGRTRTWGTRRLFPAAQGREILQGSRLPGNIVIASECEECGVERIAKARAKVAPAPCRQSRARPALAGGRDARRTAAGTAELQIITLPHHSPRSHDPRHFFRLPAMQASERRI